ncbi:MAG: DivIVA domain-containing protein [Clostridium sp.]|nr:DivIVA domain-containing protein [Clostridium sp.]MCM1171135.1 DivIVA domain-containing protein [Clostridium sp.]MCM1208953.1 DivIVA domain-containing protein [Ruminococcus sp.]
MLTPVDIQEKTFHSGLGYDKKDVNTFFEEVAKSYAELYRSNAELKEQVATLTDGLQNYKSKEAALEKSLMLAEKDSEDTKAKALKEAKNIELDAKNKAKVIVADAEKKLKKMTQEMTVLETQYAAYKSNFCSLMKMQYEFLKEKDFDLGSYIDEKALSLLGGGGGSYRAPASGGDTFSGDPQMRDESTLGGAAGGSAYNEYGEDTRTSTSAVYTAGLGANENFVDPFNPSKEENGRYNPYDGRTAKSSTAGSSFKVSSGNKSGQKRNSSGKAKSTGSSSTHKSAKAAEESKPDPSKDTHKASDTTASAKPASSVVKEEAVKTEKVTPAPEKKPEKEVEKEAKTVQKEDDGIPTIQPDVSDIEVTTANEQALLPNGDTPSEEADDDGFEFV